ncbi:MAG: sugar phosphate isomerase/epimerase [Bacillota bacterium]
MIKFQLAAFSDEASLDLMEQIAACKTHGVTHIELRNYSINGGPQKNSSDTTIEEAKEIKAILDANDMKVSAIGSKYGKIEIDEDFIPHFEAFKNTVEVAKILGTDRIRMFSFFFTKGQSIDLYREEVIRRVRVMAEYSYARGVLCCHENEKDIYGDIADRCVDLHKELGEILGGVFDPSNYIQCGEDTIEAYAKVSPYITYFHIKDCQKSDGYVVPAGHGDGNIGILLTEYAKKGENLIVTMEPHLKVFEGLAALDKDSDEKAESNDKYNFKDNLESFAFACGAYYEVLSSINK